MGWRGPGSIALRTEIRGQTTLSPYFPRQEQVDALSWPPLPTPQKFFRWTSTPAIRLQRPLRRSEAHLAPGESLDHLWTPGPSAPLPETYRSIWSQELPCLRQCALLPPMPDCGVFHHPLL